MENYESLSGSHHCFHGFGVRHWIVMRVELHLNHCYLKWTIGFKKLPLSWWTLFGHLIFVWSFLSSLLKLQNTLNYIRKWENRPLLTGIMLYSANCVFFAEMLETCVFCYRYAKCHTRCRHIHGPSWNILILIRCLFCSITTDTVTICVCGTTKYVCRLDSCSEASLHQGNAWNWIRARAQLCQLLNVFQSQINDVLYLHSGIVLIGCEHRLYSQWSQVKLQVQVVCWIQFFKWSLQDSILVFIFK